MEVITEDKDVYRLVQRQSGFYGLSTNPNTVVAFVRDSRLKLCEDAMKGEIDITMYPDPSGRNAIGLYDPKSRDEDDEDSWMPTLSPTPPVVGFRMFIIDASTVKPMRLTEPIKEIR